MIDLARRMVATEILDGPGVRYDEFGETLRQFGRINRLTGSYRPALKALRQLWQENQLDRSTPFRVLDIGSGYGDYLRRIHRWADSLRISVQLTGLDRNPWAERVAREATPEGMNIEYVTSDIFAYHPNADYHVIISSMLTHHLSNEQIIRLLKWMTHHARYGWFINDLHRHRLAYYATRLFLRALGVNRIHNNDGPISVTRSFTRRDWETLLRQTPLERHQVVIRSHFPFRYGVFYHV